MLFRSNIKKVSLIDQIEIRSLGTLLNYFPTQKNSYVILIIKRKTNSLSYSNNHVSGPERRKSKTSAQENEDDDMHN